MLRFSEAGTSRAFSFATPSRSEVAVDILPAHWHHRAPVYLPTHELLTIYPGFVPLYETRDVEFEETWRDTCLEQRYFALRRGDAGAVVSGASEVSGVDPLILLDEELLQSDRFVEEFMP